MALGFETAGSWEIANREDDIEELLLLSNCFTLKLVGISDF